MATDQITVRVDSHDIDRINKLGARAISCDMEYKELTAAVLAGVEASPNAFDEFTEARILARLYLCNLYRCRLLRFIWFGPLTTEALNLVEKRVIDLERRLKRLRALIPSNARKERLQ